MLSCSNQNNRLQLSFGFDKNNPLSILSKGNIKSAEETLSAQNNFIGMFSVNSQAE
jgi:hypothetical protein